VISSAEKLDEKNNQIHGRVYNVVCMLLMLYALLFGKRKGKIKSSCALP
jgi:hypothetical protein